VFILCSLFQVSLIIANKALRERREEPYGAPIHSLAPGLTRKYQISLKNLQGPTLYLILLLSDGEEKFCDTVDRKHKNEGKRNRQSARGFLMPRYKNVFAFVVMV
jgi:hypothetical protein